jgi:hypothetical protein
MVTWCRSASTASTPLTTRYRKLKRLRAASRAAPGDQGLRVELGRRFASALDARRASDRRDLARRLGKVAVATRLQDASGDFGLAVVSCLVSRDGLGRFDDQVSRIEAEHPGLLTVRVLGPLPPYSFVDGALGGGR